MKVFFETDEQERQYSGDKLVLAHPSEFPKKLRNDQTSHNKPSVEQPDKTSGENTSEATQSDNESVNKEANIENLTQYPGDQKSSRTISEKPPLRYANDDGDFCLTTFALVSGSDRSVLLRYNDTVNKENFLEWLESMEGEIRWFYNNKVWITKRKKSDKS